jgi:membrane fusion protein, multidrug efflux system
MTTRTLFHSKPRFAGAAFALLVAGSGPALWLHSRHFETTDDAQVEGHLNAISARVNGTVTRISPAVENNHFVEAGTLLVELDPQDYDVAVEQARAALSTKEAAAAAAAFQVPVVRATAFGQLDQARAGESEAIESVAVEEANLVAAQHRVEHDVLVSARAERDRQRYLTLVEKREISRSEYDGRETDARTAVEQLETDRASVVAAQNKVAQARRRVEQRRADLAGARSAPEQWWDAKARSAASAAQVKQARADLRSAELNLSYTRIYAPVSGIVGRKTVEIGHRVQPGQALLIVVPVDDLWITANFKETQLQSMRPGQAVDVHVDAFGRDYHGTVDEMPGAAGTLFSLLPPENATGNYVKVVQRLPVRIRLDAADNTDHRLRPGMSVEARVRVN